MPEGVAHETQEWVLGERRKCRALPRAQRDDRGVDTRRRPERTGSDATHESRLRERLDEDREITAFLRVAGRGHDPPGDLVLDQYPDERRPPRVREEAL